MSARLERLLGFLKTDPSNPHLLADTAEAAFEARQFENAASLIDRHPTPLPARLANIKGLIALEQRHYKDAMAIFEALRPVDDNPALRFNLAWAKAMQDDYAGALELLDDETLTISVRAPALKIHAMHHLALYEDALACGDILSQQFPNNKELLGALATLAMDAERSDLARDYATRAGDAAEGQAVLGLFMLGDHDLPRALVMFDQAIAADTGNPRAWIGKGLGLLAAGDSRAGAQALDHGAELFAVHLGSWIASGWAYFMSGDNAKARSRFERALAIDANFAESHGGLAVVEIAEGHLEAAQRACDIALRLDRNCFAGALAKSLLLEQSGHPRSAQKVREAAFIVPIGPGKRTLAQEIVALGQRPVLPKSGAARKSPG